jgi:hypothetical protein
MVPWRRAGPRQPAAAPVSPRSTRRGVRARAVPGTSRSLPRFTAPAACCGGHPCALAGPAVVRPPPGAPTKDTPAGAAPSTLPLPNPPPRPSHPLPRPHPVHRPAPSDAGARRMGCGGARACAAGPHVPGGRASRPLRRRAAPAPRPRAPTPRPQPPPAHCTRDRHLAKPPSIPTPRPNPSRDRPSAHRPRRGRTRAGRKATGPLKPFDTRPRAGDAAARPGECRGRPPGPLAPPGA